MKNSIYNIMLKIFFLVLLLNVSAYTQIWQSLSSPGGTQIIFATDKIGWTFDSEIQKTIDGGKTFYKVNISPTNFNGYLAPFFLNQYKGWLGAKSDIYFTDDGGSIWTKRNSQANTSLKFYVKFFDENNGFVVGCNEPPETMYRSSIDKTTDGGQTWTTTIMDTVRLSQAFFLDSQTGWVSGGTGLLKTTNGGTSWEKISNVNVGNIFFASKDTGWAFGDHLQKTTDGGFTWVETSNSFIGAVCKIFFTNSKIGYVLSNGGIYKTTDGGDSWKLQSVSGGLENLQDFSFVNPNNMWLIASSRVVCKYYGEVELTAPNGGEVWRSGQQKQITWTNTNLDTVALQYSTDNGNNWLNITTGTYAKNNSYTWSIPNTPSTQCKVRIVDYKNTGVADTSANVFTIGGYDSITYGGKTYHIVQIGTQTWLKENLDIGTMIQVDKNQTNNGAIEKYCYLNDTIYCDTYGGLYQWNEAMLYNTTPGSKGICPTGWHIPTKSEYDTLTTYVKNDGNVLKAVGQGTGHGAGTNTSGFSALLAGGRVSSGYFTDLGSNTYFSNSTEYNTENAYMLMLASGNGIISLFGSYKVEGWSVRCIKDEISTASLQLSSPNGTETWQSGSTQNITWTSTGVTDVKLEFTTNNGTNWSTIIATTPASSGSYAWTIPNTLTTQCKIKISNVNNSSLFDESDGIFNITDKTWQIFNPSNSVFPNTYVLSVAVDRAGNKWVGSNGGLAKFNGTDWTIYNSTNSGLPHNTVTSIAIDAAGNKWLGTNVGLVKYDGTNWVLYNTSNSGIPSNTVGSIVIDAAGNKWFGTWDKGLVKYDGSSWTIYNSSNSSLTQNWVRAVAFDAAGVKWIGLEDGNLFKFDGTNWAVYNSGLPNNGISSITIDRFGNKWIGTGGSGLEKFDGTTWKSYDRYNSGFPDINAQPIVIDGSGIKWIGSVYGGLVKFDDTNWTVFNPTNSGLPVDNVNSLAIDSAGNKWIGTTYGGLAVYNENGINFNQLSLLAPNGGETWQAGTTQNITWTNTGVTNVKLEYTTNSGINWTTIIASISASSGSYAWSVPGVSSANCRIRISDASNSDLTDKSDNVFTIIKVVAPPTNLTASAGNKQATLKWNKNSETDLRIYRVYGGTSANPNTKIDSVNYTDTAKTITNLTNGTTYYYRITAVDSTGNESGYSNEVSETPNETVIYGSKTYHTVRIGTQTWLKENLDIGDMIQGNSNQSNNGTIEKYCYDNNPANCDTHGGLYQWNEAMAYSTLSGSQGICPIGWHLPTITEFQTLAATVSNEGNSLKAVGQGTGSGAGTNTSGFSALLAGSRYLGNFSSLGSTANFWSSTLHSTSISRYTFLSGGGNSITEAYTDANDNGFSVRCIKDESPVASLQIVFPNGGESFVAGTVDTIKWTSTNITNVKLEYTTNSGTNWSTIIASTPASSGSYAWLIPTVSSTNCKVRISDVTNSLLADTSDNVFTINYVNGYDSLTYGGKIYHTVKIGNQTWLKENLDIGIYVASTNTGTIHSDVSNNGVIEKYCYDNNEANCATYGGLYDWNEAMQYVTTQGSQGICPTGWHLPTYAELQTLESAVGNNSNALKAIEQGSGGGAGTNTSGFSALLAGYRSSYSFISLGASTYFWSSTAYYTTYADCMGLWFNDSSIGMSSLNKENGFSIRCLKDESTTASLHIISPNGGESFVAGSVDTIKWTSTNITNIKLECTTDSGTNWTTIIASTLASGGSYAWTIPNTPSTQCKVKISDVDNASIADTSGIFTISAPVQKITVTSPNGGERWKGNSSQQITWGIGSGKQSAVLNRQSAVGKGQKVIGQESGKLKVKSIKSNLITENRELTTPNQELTTNNSIENVRIDYSTNNGSTWTTVASSVLASQNSFTWLVPKVNSQNCKVRVVDQVDTTFADTSDAAFEIYSPQITVTSPNGGEQWQSGSTHPITWTQSNTDTVKISYSTNQGTGWIAIAEKPASEGTYSWVVPSTISSTCKVKISDKTDPTFADSSNAVFAITSIPVVQVLVTSPNGGESWKVDSVQSITWTSSNVSKFKIEYKINSGVNWTQVGYAATSPYSWTVPNTVSTQCKVRVSDSTNAAICDSSDAVFTIYKPSITVVYPNGGEELQVGSNINVTWLSSNVQNVSIEYSTTNKRTWSSISASVAASNQSISWTVPDAVSDSCFIRIKDVSDNSAADTSDAKFKIIPSSPPSLTLTSPVGNEQWRIGTKKVITWSASKVNDVKITFSTNDGTSWMVITNSTPGDSGKYEWTVPSTASTVCRIKISDVSNWTVYSLSPQPFTIYYDEVVVTSPNGGENWKVDSVQSITWTSSNVSKFKIEYKINSGVNWTQVGYAATSPYSWTVPNTVSTQCKVRVSDSTNAAICDSSDAIFTIFKPSLTVVSPNGSEELQVGSNINVTWLSSNVQNVSIEYSTTNKRTWSTISASVAASNQSISWTVPDAVSDSCFIRIKDVSDNTVADTSDAKFKIIPSSPPSLTLTSPVGNEQWKLGTKHFITWTKNKVTTVKIEFSSNDGSSWSTLTSSAIADSGKYEWTVPNTASAVCRIKISDEANSLLNSVSPLPFEIYYSEIVLTAPNGGEEWMVSETHAITWTSLHVNKVKVELTTDNGANWTVQKDSATASIGNVTWVVPNIPATSTECKIKISDANDPTLFDVSEQVFTIKGLPKLQVISPKAGDVWEIGTTQAITWYRENIEQIKIELSTNRGSDWMTIASSVQASDQSYNWEVQNYLSQNCLVKISDAVNPSFSDTSDVFSIVAKVKPVVLTPNGGEKLTLGQAYDITWKLGSGKLLAPKVPSHKSGNTKGKLVSLETAATSNIRIQLSTDDGVSWAEIKNQIAVDSAKYTWTVSGEPSDKCFIKIVDINDASNFDLSDSAFVILDNKIPAILVSTNALDFGNVYQDSTEIKQINITNTGTADLQIQSTSFYQTGSAYKVTTFNQTIKPDSMRNVSISFKPTEIASYEDTLFVYHNAVGSPAKIVLTGSGIEVPKPIIKIAATTVTFDTTYIGSNNQKTITIDNEGTADLVISSITADKAVFSPLESSFTIGAGLRHILTLKFAPTSDSGYSGTLTIRHNAVSSPSTLSLIGKGKKHVPNIVLSSKEINFGVITIYTHTEVTLDINNSGTADLAVSNISSSNNGFATNLTNFVVQPNSSKAVTLTFSPINATQYTGTLTIAHNAGAGVSTVSMAGAGYPVDVIVTRTISFGDITLSGNYRMVGLPGDSSISISKTVSGTQRNDWNAFYDNGVISANQADYLKEYDGSTKFAFKPGNGFWVVSKNGLTVSANVKPVLLAADSTYSIPLQSNWNIISNPFEKSTSWTKIKQLNSLTTHPLYKWNGQNYDQVSEMTTYEGFYFYNTAGLTWLKIPYDANGTLRKFFKSREEYQLGEKGFSIDCRQEGIEKSSVYAGFNSKSSNDVDDYDYFMPPADFGEVSLVLQNDSLTTDYKKLLVEQRKEIGEGTQFDFTARNNSKQQVQLSVNGIEFFPESETYLLDKQYNKFTNLKEKNVFTLPQQMGKRNYALLVGSQSFIQERKAAIIPTEYLLYQNFPNPFNPATTIAFGLPKESNVTLTLYNMLGEVVLKNELGNKASGYHELLLDLSSKSSGVYFYAIQANALDGSKVFREVKKMMLLK